MQSYCSSQKQNPFFSGNPQKFHNPFLSSVSVDQAFRKKTQIVGEPNARESELAGFFAVNPLNAWPLVESKKIHILSEVDRYLLKPLVRGFSKVV